MVLFDFTFLTTSARIFQVLDIRIFETGEYALVSFFFGFIAYFAKKSSNHHDSR